MGRAAVESIMGGVVLLAAGLFLAYAHGTMTPPPGDGYRVDARFFSVGGVKPGADVRINGVTVGRVAGATLDRESYDAVLTLELRDDIRLPVDTVAAIGSDGLLDGPHVRLEPGGADQRVPSGGQIARTIEFKTLEDRVAEIIFLAAGQENRP